jgi:RNA polymerase sigma factor for flagellar operon FliA
LTRPAGKRSGSSVTEEEVRARIGELTAEIFPAARSEAYRVWQRAPHALELDELEALALSGLAAAAARWPAYCAKHGHDPSRFEYFYAYALRRMRGSMLDYLRSQDWVTRSARTKAKMLREAGQDRGLSDAELAKATGMGIDEVRATAAAVSARPVSMDAEPYDVAGTDDVEGQAVVSQVLAAMSGAIGRLSARERVILVLRYYHGMTLPELAPYAGVTPDEAARLHQVVILECHAEMLKVVA